MAAIPVSLEDPRLAEAAHELEQGGLAAELYDDQWNLVWVSSELKTLLGCDDPVELGIGENVWIARLRPAWWRSITAEARAELTRIDTPYMLHDLGVSGRDLAVVAPPELASIFEAAEPAQPPPLYVHRQAWVPHDSPETEIVRLYFRLRDSAGATIGTVLAYAPSLPARLVALTARGEEAMFERMARLTEPGRRQAAVLFADLQASGVLSRRLPSAGYFKLIRALTTAIDEVVVRGKGIVGKHAGDGVTAFFLAEDCGSASAAARAAIEAARGIREEAAAVAGRLGEKGVAVEPHDCLLNIGVHWGDTLYMGQVVTGGRLEVTALGDEVNEGARIQQAARDGELLVSKGVVERLDAPDASALGLDPDGVSYRTVAELPGAGEKAVRDAGGIPVTAI